MARIKKEPTKAPLKKRRTSSKKVTSTIVAEEPIAAMPEESPSSPLCETPRTQPRVSRRVGIIAFIVVLLTISIIGYVAFSKTDAERAEKEVQTLIADVSELILLPQNEVPLIYTIDDPDFLRIQQPFFADATKGDILLVYPAAVKAIIYSPERNIIVNVGVVSTETGTQQGSDTGLIVEEELGSNSPIDAE